MKSLFKGSKINYKKTINSLMLENDVAHIACKVDGIDRIINPYSVNGYEILNSEFEGFLLSFSDIIPENAPVLLEITGTEFDSSTQVKITDTIRRNFKIDYAHSYRAQQLGLIKILWFAVFFIVFFAILLIANQWPGGPVTELLYLMFWFFGDRFIDYMLLEQRGYRKSRARMAQLYSMEIIFTDSYKDDMLSEAQAEEIFENVRTRIDNMS